jgi:tetratricopeptide (TPR) repeat protein
MPTFDELALEALVTRVEGGQALTREELVRLERAVAAHPGSVDWLLCLAHALSNGDRPESSLSVVARAAALAPDEPLVRLARARALGALERWPEAQAQLEAVLARAPGHADALRALALVRLRSGAVGDAARLIRKVLEADPLDEASRQILAESEAGQGEPSLPQFERDLRRSLAERGIKSRLDPARQALLVELGPGRIGRLSLASLRQAAAADLRGEAGFSEALVGSLSRLEAPDAVPRLEEVRARLLPALRPARFKEKAGPVLSAPGPADLLWVWALDHAGFVTFLHENAAASWGIPLEEIRQIAFDNLDRSPLTPTRYRVVEGRLMESSEAWEVVGFDAGDGCDASRLLAPRHRMQLDALYPGPWVVALPTISYALLAREGDEQAIALLRAACVESQGPDGLHGALLSLATDLAVR